MNNQLVLTKQEKDLIEQYYHEWENDSLRSIRNSIRTKLYHNFERRCFYCREEVRQSTGDYDVEHIVPKSKYVKFSFHEKNLTISCKECNRFKLQKDTLIPSLQNGTYEFHQYPTSKEDFLIVHANYDDYEECITTEDYIFQVGLNSKGINTIKMCNLNRLYLAEERVRRVQQGYFNRVTRASRNNNYEKDLEELEKELSEIGFKEAIFSLSAADKNVIDIADALYDEGNKNDLELEKNLKLLTILLDKIDSLKAHDELVRFVKDRVNISSLLIDGDKEIINSSTGYFALTLDGLAKLEQIITENKIHWKTLESIKKLHQQVFPVDISAVTELLKKRTTVIDLVDSFNNARHRVKSICGILNQATIENIERAIGNIKPPYSERLPGPIRILKHIREFHEMFFSHPKFDEIGSIKKRFGQIIRNVD